MNEGKGERGARHGEPAIPLFLFHLLLLLLLPLLPLRLHFPSERVTNNVKRRLRLFSFGMNQLMRTFIVVADAVCHFCSRSLFLRFWLPVYGNHGDEVVLTVIRKTGVQSRKAILCRLVRHMGIHFSLLHTQRRFERREQRKRPVSIGQGNAG